MDVHETLCDPHTTSIPRLDAALRNPSDLSISLSLWDSNYEASGAVLAPPDSTRTLLDNPVFAVLYVREEALEIASAEGRRSPRRVPESHPHYPGWTAVRRSDAAPRLGRRESGEAWTSMATVFTLSAAVTAVRVAICGDAAIEGGGFVDMSISTLLGSEGQRLQAEVQCDWKKYASESSDSSLELEVSAESLQEARARIALAVQAHENVQFEVAPLLCQLEAYELAVENLAARQAEDGEAVATLQAEVAAMCAQCDADAALRTQLLKADGECAAKVAQLTKQAQQIESALRHQHEQQRRQLHLMVTAVRPSQHELCRPHLPVCPSWATALGSARVACAQSYWLPTEAAQRQRGDTGTSLRNQVAYEAPSLDEEPTAAFDGLLCTETVYLPRTTLQVASCWMKSLLRCRQQRLLKLLRSPVLAMERQLPTEDGMPSGEVPKQETVAVFTRALAAALEELQEFYVLTPWYRTCADCYEFLNMMHDAETTALQTMDGVDGTAVNSFLKPSTMKNDARFAFVATNLCVQRSTVQSVPTPELHSAEEPSLSNVADAAPTLEAAAAVITSGAPVAHFLGLKHGLRHLAAESQVVGMEGARRLDVALGQGVAIAVTAFVRSIFVVPYVLMCDWTERLSRVCMPVRTLVMCVHARMCQQFAALEEPAMSMLPALSNTAHTQALLHRGQFLLGFESLLSTRGKELAMLEDLSGVVDALHGMTLRCTARTDGGPNTCVSIYQGHLEPAAKPDGVSSLELHLALEPHCYSQLWDSAVPGPKHDKQERVILATAVLFSKGINEEQSLALKLNSTKDLMVQVRILDVCHQILADTQ